MIVFGVIVTVIGAIAFMIGWTVLQKRRSWMKTTGRTFGQVEDGRIVYEVAGQSYALRITRTNLQGRSLPIRYALDKPGQSRIDAPLATWLAPGFFLLLGTGLLLIGIGMIKS
ncbi:hypothetical protein [Siphonobacter sp.]|uniref:hypothetical protein n=1 Tax=Siphonobacter sp. TaxID=1869184 RepID=UPI003B3A8D5A